jgi:hypothetical protein
MTKGFHQIETWVGEEDAIAVVISLTRGTPGRYSGPPEDCYPDDPPEMEWEVRRPDGRAWTGELSDADEQRIESELWAAIGEQDVRDHDEFCSP